ncbi:MAG TPA: DUF4097 family beta strand repeat-containing protein [Acidobacteriota bacterium]|nr:DUF4097 family beta strand repeat-containing protein [Acidobacteriota bacterium]
MYLSFTLAFAFLIGGLAPQESPRTERLIEAGEVQRIEINPLNKGSLRISGWDQPQVQVKAYHSPRISFEIQANHRLIKVEERRPSRSALEDVRLEIQVPMGLRLQVIGNMPEVSIEGLEGAVDVNTNQGNIALSNVSGSIRLTSSGGRLELSDVGGILRLRTSHEGISVKGLTGDLEAETVSGDILLQGIASKRIHATSHQGGIVLEGALAEDGVYDLASDNGGLELRLSEPLSASFTVGTVQGDFYCEFNLQGVQPRKGERFTFSVGDGAAQVDLLTFRGAIRIGRR